MSADHSTLTNSYLEIEDGNDYTKLNASHLTICFDDYPYIELIDRNGGFQWRIKNEDQNLSFVFS